MVENETGRGKNSQEQHEDFFAQQTLMDIYGSYTLKPGTNIVTEIPYEEFIRIERDPTTKDELREQLKKKYNIPHIGSYRSQMEWTRDENGKPMNAIKNPNLTISAGRGEPTVYWAPFVAERGAIAALATRVTSHEKPLILNLNQDPNTQFTSNLLSTSGDLQVINVDLGQTKSLDLLDEFGPTRSPEELAKIKSLILGESSTTARNRINDFLGGGAFSADRGEEMQELQTIASGTGNESPVDIAIFNYPQFEEDLTLQIRDGIHPKIIMYVKPVDFPLTNDFYHKNYEDSQGVENEPLNYNPGKNYQTLTRWQTFWEDDWGFNAYGFEIGSNIAEVVVQMRKDVQFKGQSSLPEVPTYDWDAHIVDIVRKNKADYHRNTWGYYSGIDHYDGLRDLQEILELK